MSDPIPGTGMNVPNAPPTAEPSVLNITLSQGSPFSIENTAVKSEPKMTNELKEENLSVQNKSYSRQKNKSNSF